MVAVEAHLIMMEYLAVLVLAVVRFWLGLPWVVKE
jgi:hypothetical protein